jgi:DNA (cytosine-5)-methyltransferase 1
MENVGGIPDVKIPGYSWQRLDLRANWFGLNQSRKRYIQFGHRDNLVLTVEPSNVVPATEPICLASEGKKTNRRGWSEFCQLQGLSPDFDLPSFSLSAKYKAVGNGVPVPMARALARGIKSLRSDVTPCLCGCGREVTGKAITAGPACRKRLQRRRERCDAPEL